MAGVLFSSGGRSSAKGQAINVWDLHRESCVLQLLVGDDPGDVQHLAAAKKSPVLFAADSGGHISLHDLRAKQQIGQLAPLKDALIGMAVEPGETEKQFVLGFRNGTISFHDWRMSDTSASTSLWRTLEGHSKGNVAAICAHETAPLVATATASQVVKIWNMRAEQVGVVRPQTSILAQPIGPATCLAFAPYSLQLASGGGDAICAVYSLELCHDT